MSVVLLIHDPILHNLGRALGNVLRHGQSLAFFHSVCFIFHKYFDRQVPLDQCGNATLNIYVSIITLTLHRPRAQMKKKS